MTAAANRRPWEHARSTESAAKRRSNAAIVKKIPPHEPKIMAYQPISSVKSDKPTYAP
jgi:hypothetical protein